MRTSELLKEAERYLWDGSDSNSYCESCICSALWLATASFKNNPRMEVEARVAVGKARRRIRAALGGHDLYIGWAIAQGHLPPDWPTNAEDWWPVIQANRLNWLRELQREFKEKGD